MLSSTAQSQKQHVSILIIIIETVKVFACDPLRSLITGYIYLQIVTVELLEVKL